MEEISYYSFAYDDYQFLKANVEMCRTNNAMTSIAQNICEKFLKHLIVVFCTSVDCTAVLKTHSLKRILRFLEQYLPDFSLDRKKVMLADGYYFSARYPGDESFFVNAEDVQICWEAAEETKRAVDRYLEKQKAG
ncbi:MAG TPA: hypothetical protein DF613_10720 [Lachnospiraceae bacterium]|nr:hypothetical protein [Lachnospiraceae bacterium]